MKKIKALLTAALLAIAIPAAGSLTACGKKGEEEIVETTKYTFSAPAQDEYTVQIVSPSIFLDNEGKVEVDEGTTVKFIIQENPLYSFSQAIVKANQTVLQKNADSTYTVVVNENITISVDNIN